MDSNDELKEIDIKICACYHYGVIIKIKDFNHDNILRNKKSYKNILFLRFHAKLWLMLNLWGPRSIKKMDLLEFIMELDIQYYLKMKNII